MAGGSCIRCGTDDGEGQFRAENSPVTWVGRYRDRTSDLLGVNQVLPVSGGVCDGRRLPLNWAIAPSDSYRHLTTLRRMAPENGSPDLEDQQPPGTFELTAGRLSSAGRGDLRPLAIGRCRGSPRQAMSAAVRRRCRGR